MSEQKITMKRTISNNWFLLKIALQEAPLFTIEELTTLARHRLIVFIEHIYMIGYIINAIQYQKPFMEVFWFIAGVFTFVIVVAQILPNYVDTKLKPVSREKIHRRIRSELYRKAAEMDLKNYDDPEFYNEFVWAMGEAAERTEAVIGSYASLIGETVGIFVVAGYVLSQDLAGLWLTGVSVALLLLLSNLYNKYRMRFREEIRPLERKRDYISRVFYLPEYAKELRLSKVKPKLYEEFQEASAQILDISKKRTRRLQVLKMCIQYGCSSLIFDGIYLTYLMFQTLVKEAFGYGTAVALYNSCGNLRNCSRSLAQVLTEFPEHGRYIEKIRHFLNCPVEIRQKEEAKAVREEFAELKLEHISFSYPGGASVLKDINDRISA